MNTILFYTILGYWSGSVLYAEVGSRYLGRSDPTRLPTDHNPGAFNAFRYNGLLWGTFTLVADLSKGFVPVWLYLHQGLDSSLLEKGLSFVIAAPVLGHVYPFFFHFHGGEGISTTFGVLLAVWIDGISSFPVWTFALLFLSLKFLIGLRPDYYLTLMVYFLLPLILIFEKVSGWICLGTFLISGGVLIKMLVFFPKPKEKMEIIPVWKH